MGTLVQSPDLVQATVTGAQTAAKPVERGLGSFLSDLIPVGQELVDKHVADNAAHLRALGQNDVLNDKFSEVSYLGRKSYAEGRTYQTVVNSRAVLEQDFKAKVDSSQDPEEWGGYIKEYSDATIQNIKEADLSTEVKAKLYEAQLQNNATYMSMIEKRTTKLNQDLAYETRTVESAGLVDVLTNEDMDAAEVVLTVQSFYDRGLERTQQAHPDMSREDVDKQLQGDIVAAFDVVFEGIKPNPDEATVKRLNMFSAVMDELPAISMEAAKKWKQTANNFATEFYNQQFTLTMGQVEELRFQAKLDPTKVPPAKLDDTWEQVQAVEGFTPEQKLQAKKVLNGIHYDTQVALQNGEAIYNARSMSKSDAIVSELSPSEVLNQAEKGWVQENRLTAGFEMIRHYGMGAEYWSEGVTRGSKLAVTTFLPYLNLTDNDVKSSEYDAHHNQSFDTFKLMYNEAAANNTLLANEMLSAIPSDQREVFISALENNQSLEWVRRKMQNYETSKAEYANVNDAVEGLTLEAVGVGGLKNKFFGNTGGMNDSAREAFLFRKKAAGKQSVNTLVKSVSTDSPRQAAIELAKQDLTSPAGLSPVIANARTDRMLRYLSAQGDAPIAREYLASAVDELRVRDAEGYNVDSDNTVAYFDDTGDHLLVEYYNDDGLLSGDGSKNTTLRYRTADILVRSRELYAKDKERKRQQKVNPSKQNPNLVVDEIATSDRVTGKNTKIPLTVSMVKNFGSNSNIAKGVLGDLEYWYGFSSKPVEQTNGTTAVGIGFDSGKQHEWAVAHIKRAASNPNDTDKERTAKVVKAQDEVINRTLQNVPLMSALRDVGVPKPTQDLYPKQHRSTLQTMYTTAILHGKDGLFGNKSTGYVGVVDVYNSSNYNQAKLKFRQSKLYSEKHPKRNAYYLEQIKQHLKLRGK